MIPTEWLYAGAAIAAILLVGLAAYIWREVRRMLPELRRRRRLKLLPFGR